MARGRKPTGEVALTAAQKQKAYRDRQRAEKLLKAAERASKELKSELIDLSAAAPVWRR